MAESVYRPGKLQYVIEPFDIAGVTPITAADRKAALNEVADYLHETVLSKIGSAVSPVAGGKWKQTLSADYKAIKQKISGSAIPNMELYGDMLDALVTKAFTATDQVALVIEGAQAEKADGHNKLTGRKNFTPERQFIPGADDKFKADILAGIKRIVKSYDSEKPSASIGLSDFVNTFATTKAGGKNG
jgi:hypothetical protein